MVEDHEARPAGGSGAARWVAEPMRELNDNDALPVHACSIPEELLTTDDQRELRHRILDAARDLASASGYNGVHMRRIADLAAVSIGSVYHYFPSKVHLLAMTLEREIIRFDECLINRPRPVGDPFAILRSAVWELINSMERSDIFTHALSRAYVASYAVASQEAEIVWRHTSVMFARAMSVGHIHPLEHHLPVADLMTEVWTAEVRALAHGRRSYSEMRQRLSAVIDLAACAERL